MNGLTGLVVTKLDVLTGIDPLHIGVRYLGPEGATFDDFPYHQSIVHRVQGDYIELPGWHEDIRGCRSIDELPANAQAYLDYISESLGVPIVMVGVGPGREQMIWTGAAEHAAPAPPPRAYAWTTWVDTTMSCSARFSSSQSGQKKSRNQGMNGMIDEAIPTPKPLDHDLAQGGRAEVHRLAAVADHPDAERLLAPRLAVVRPSRAIRSGAVEEAPRPGRRGSRRSR